MSERSDIQGGGEQGHRVHGDAVEDGAITDQRDEQHRQKWTTSA